MKVEPQGIIRLCKTPLESDYKNQLTFVTKVAQIIYFNDTVVKSFDENTYIRKDGALKVDCNIEEIRQCNYLFYSNMGFDDRTYYCFITGLKYISENSTLIEYETDCYQTWMFDIQYNPCFIEREHVADDTVGLHTVPENLELGEYEIVDVRNSPMYHNTELGAGDDFLPCFCVTNYNSSFQNLDATTGRVKGDLGYIGQVFSSLKFFAVGTLAQARLMIEAYNQDPNVTADAIVNIFMIPSCCINKSISQVDSTTFANGAYKVMPIYNYWLSDEYKLQEPDVLAEDYHPVNAKLLTYPYSYFYLSNGAGEEVQFKYEDFPIETLRVDGIDYTRRTMTYQKAVVPSCGVAGKLYFTKYKGYTEQTNSTEMYNYGISYGKLPVCAWTTDYYTNWITQNGVNTGASVLTSTITGAASGALMSGGNPAGAIAGAAIGLLGGATQAVTKMQQASVVPDQAKGDINAGDFNFTFRRNAIRFYEMSIRPEYARIIDNYFSMFGYKVNVVKTPSFMSRPEWNYIKTIGCNIDGEIPQEDLSILKKMFDSGVTLWHHADTMYDYTQNNNV